MFLVHVYLDNAAIADSFLSAKAELYGNSPTTCSVATFWPKENSLFKVHKECSGDGKVSTQVSFSPMTMSSQGLEASLFTFEKTIDLRSGGQK